MSQVDELRAAIAALQKENEGLANGLQPVVPKSVPPAILFGAGAVVQAAIGSEKLSWLMTQCADGAPELIAWAKTDEFQEWARMGLDSFETYLKPIESPSS